MKSWLAVGALCVFTAIGFGQNTLEEYQQMLQANRKSSLAHYGVGDIYLQQHAWQAAANAFRLALDGDFEPQWTVVWSHIGLGKIFDVTGQRDRAVDQYKLAIQTNDDTRAAQAEAAKYLQSPYKP